MFAEAVMYYLLVFLGLIGVALIVAMSPLVIRLFEYFFRIAQSDGPPVKSAKRTSVERSEIRDEIRRLTVALETDRRGDGRKGLQSRKG
jgi:hypothetical protein